MKNHAQQLSNNVGLMADDAQTFIASTAEFAEEKIGEARKHLTSALERGKEIYTDVREKEIQGARALDEAVQGHVYGTIAIGVGLGVLIGWLMSRR